MAAAGPFRPRRLPVLLFAGLAAAAFPSCGFLCARTQAPVSTRVRRKAVEELVLVSTLAASSAALWQSGAELLEGLVQDSPPEPVPEFLAAANSPDQVMIGVTGASGAGKSSVVNALRSLRDTDQNAAQTGITETTLTPAMYAWRPRKGHAPAEGPDSPAVVQQAVLWDLPGIGTPRFPQASYLKHMGVRHFDLVLLVTAARLTESELQLVAELEAYGVPYFLVRNKIDVDIEAELLRQEEEEEVADNEEGMLQEVTVQTMETVKQELRMLTGMPEVYCISTRRRCRKRHDFPKLVHDIKRAVAEHLRERQRESVLV